MGIHPSICSPSREAALSRLKAMVPKLGKAYAADRNFDRGMGNHSAVSMLSPLVRHRLILEEELISYVIRKHGYQSSQKFIQEVFWRTYWKGWLELRPGVWDDYKKERDSAKSSYENNTNFQEAVEGRTGIDCFDYWVAEIKETNYLHNHARMWFASIWIFTLGLPWVLGADFFLKYLLDGDPASNTLSWRWVAGIQTQGKTYLASAENIKRFTEGRFNPAGQLATKARPIIGPQSQMPSPINVDPLPKFGVKTLWLVTEDNLTLEEPPVPPKDLVGVIALNASENRALGGSAERVTKFAENAISGATRNFNLQHGIPVEQLSVNKPTDFLSLLKKYEAPQTVISRIPVGPGRDFFYHLENTMQMRDIEFTEITRKWDFLCWPHATRGFFKFKEAIPSILTKMNLL